MPPDHQVGGGGGGGGGSVPVLPSAMAVLLYILSSEEGQPLHEGLSHTIYTPM